MVMDATAQAERGAQHLLTAAEVAAELRVSYQGCLGMIRRGVVPGRKVGKSYRVRRQDLDALTLPEVGTSGRAVAHERP